MIQLFDPTKQFETRSGTLNTAGQLRVYINGTDNQALVYDDAAGHTIKPQPIILDDNGRAGNMFVDGESLYRLEVYDRYGALLWTVTGMSGNGAGGGGVMTDVVVRSTDGTVDVRETTEAGTDVFDLSVSGMVPESAFGAYTAYADSAFQHVSAMSSYATTLDLAGKLDASASGDFYPMTGNPSGFLTSVDLSDYATTTYVDSSLSSKMDASASSNFYPYSGNPSGFLTGVDLSPYQLTADMTAYAFESSNSAKLYTSAIECDTASAITAIGGSSIGGGAQVVTATAGDLNFVTSVNGSGLAPAWGAKFSGIGNRSGVIQFGGTAGTDPGLYLTDTLGKSYYKTNELSLTRNHSSANLIQFNCGSLGQDIVASGSTGIRARVFLSKKSASAELAALHTTAGVGVAGIGLSSTGAYAGLTASSDQCWLTLTDTAYTSQAYPSSINLWNSAASSVSAKLYTSAIECDTASTITAIGGSSIGGGLASVSATTATLSGDGTSASPLGLRDGWCLSSTAGLTQVYSNAFSASSTAGPYMYGHMSAGALYFEDSNDTAQQIAFQWKYNNAVQMSMHGEYGGSAASSLLDTHRLELSIANNNQRVLLMPDYMRMTGYHWAGTGTGSTSDIRPYGMYVEKQGGQSAEFEATTWGMYDDNVQSRELTIKPGRLDWHAGDNVSSTRGNTVYWDNDVGSISLDGGYYAPEYIRIDYGRNIMNQVLVGGYGTTTVRPDQVWCQHNSSRDTFSMLDSQSLTFRSATGTGDFDFVECSISYDTLTSLSAWATAQGWTGV